MDEIQFRLLLEKYQNETYTREELVLLESWYMAEAKSRKPEMKNVPMYDFESLIWDDIKQHTGVKHNLQKASPVRLWARFAAAASIVLCISFGGYYFLHKQQSGQTEYKNDVAPGHSQATLTLANGQKILLTKGLYKKLAQGNTAIQINNGITYTTGINAKAKTIYNTLSTAIGEQSPYPLVLPDGSKVWLNAKSSITFPTAFNGKERIVRITGEALFEVAHNAEHPFKVQTEKQTIEDIGTTFDVNAYADEPNTKTTLIEGSIKVNGLILEPGQQTDGTRIKIVNTNIYTAWKDGNFHFEDDNIQTVMRQLARWYNIDVNYQGQISNNVFYADITRNRNISAVLEILQNTNGVHFKIEGRRVTVIE